MLVGLVIAVAAGCTDASASTPPATRASPPAVATDKPVARLYPYELSWPSDELERKWRYASIAWDGVERIDHGNAFTDSVRTHDGELFAFGAATTGTAADLQARTAETAARDHGCDAEPIDEGRLDAGGEAGIVAVHNCGAERVVRWFAVHKGFGLVVMLIVAPDADPDAVRSRFVERIALLTWSR